MKRLRVLVCGDRNWTDDDSIVFALNDIYNWAESMTVIAGAARGADTVAEAWADAMINLGEDVELETYPAQWGLHGKKAGPLRNIQMLEEGRPKMVLAFHPDLDHSKGTKHMVKIAREQGLSVTVFGGRK